MTPEGVGTLIGAIIGTLITTVIAGVAVLPKIMKAVGVSADNAKQLIKHTSRIEELSASLDILSKANDNLRKEVDDLTTDKNNLSSEIKQKTAEIKQLREQLNKADDRQRESERTHARMQGQLDEQRLNYESIIDRTQRRLEELITANAAEKQRTLTLERSLKDEQQKHTEQTNIITALESELDRTKTELTLAKSELTLTKSELAETKDELIKLRNEQAATSRLLAEEQGKRIAMELVVTGLQAKVDQLLNKSSALIPPGFEADPPTADL